MEKLKCSNCGAFLQYEEGSKVAKCSFCGCSTLVPTNETTINYVNVEQTKSIKEEIEIALKDARHYVNTKNYYAAISVYNDLLSEHSHIYEAYKGIIECYYLLRQKPDFEKVVSNLDEINCYENILSFKDIPKADKEEIKKYAKDYFEYNDRIMSLSIEELNKEKDDCETRRIELDEIEKSPRNRTFNIIYLILAILTIVGVFAFFYLKSETIRIVGIVVAGVCFLSAIVLTFFTSQKKEDGKEYDKEKLLIQGQNAEYQKTNIEYKKVRIDSQKEKIERL